MSAGLGSFRMQTAHTLPIHRPERCQEQPGRENPYQWEQGSCGLPSTRYKRRCKPMGHSP